MGHGQEHPEYDGGETPQRVNSGSFPEWAKFALAMATTLAAMFTWANSTFVSRVEYIQHTQANGKELDRLAGQQEHYADAERVTATTLSTINSRLTGIEAKVELLLNAHTTMVEGREVRPARAGAH